MFFKYPNWFNHFVNVTIKRSKWSIKIFICSRDYKTVNRYLDGKDKASPAYILREVPSALNIRLIKKGPDLIGKVFIYTLFCLVVTLWYFGWFRDWAGGTSTLFIFFAHYANGNVDVWFVFVLENKIGPFSRNVNENVERKNFVN